MSNVTQLPPPQALQFIGPERRGNEVIVEGRCIPGLHVHDLGDFIEIILDGRFSYTVPKAEAYNYLQLAANCLAIGAGYSHIGAETKDRPFAPQVHFMELS